LPICKTLAIIEMNKTLLKLSTLLVIGILTISNSWHKKDSSFEKETPPGTIKISENFYSDYTEITNFDWLEYMYWTQRVFGDSSKEHIASMPDKNVWINEYPCLSNYSDFYYGHPSYRSYPAVGVSQKQAIDYCKWRSDRVFEMLLIREGVLDHNPDQNTSNYFSIDNYYNGKYNNTPPDLKYNIYPHYKLPSEKEWIEVKDYFLINKGKIKKCKQKYCSLHLKTTSLPVVYNINPCLKDSLVSEPTKSVSCFKNKKIGYYLYGNVSEWLSTENQHIGGSWRDTSIINFNTPLKSKYPTDYIGFRSVFNWKKYKKNS
jgi:hypothetical protein